MGISVWIVRRHRHMSQPSWSMQQTPTTWLCWISIQWLGHAAARSPPLHHAVAGSPPLYHCNRDLVTTWPQVCGLYISSGSIQTNLGLWMLILKSAGKCAPRSRTKEGCSEEKLLDSSGFHRSRTTYLFIHQAKHKITNKFHKGLPANQHHKSIMINQTTLKFTYLLG